MPRVGLEPTISAGERPKTYALDRAATGTPLHMHNLNANTKYQCLGGVKQYTPWSARVSILSHCVS